MLPLSRRAKNCARRWGDRRRQSETPRVLSAGSLTPFLSWEGKAYLTLHCLSQPSQRLPGWRVQSSLEADEAKPPLLMMTGADPNSSPWPRLAPRWPSATSQVQEEPSGTRSLFWIGRGAYPPPQSSLQPSCLPCKQPNTPHCHLEARGGCLRALGSPGLFELSLDRPPPPPTHTPRAHLPRN